MCGIVGILDFTGERADRSELLAMLQAVAHRGPDGEGTFVEGALGLGHRRLAIIDVSVAANQPMLTPDERYTIVYNGEIYNFRELRAELEGLGRVFRTSSDTEVLLIAFAEWGEAVLPRLNGMFAFAIWDSVERQLFLARDRYGKKPLYYWNSSGQFLFASEQKAILECSKVSKRPDLEALLEYFTFQNLLTDRTLLKGIRMFPAGSWVRLSADAQPEEFIPTRFWDFRFQEESPQVSDVEYLEELERLFVQAVQRQLVSDVEIGAYLSGGLDSGAITAIAARSNPYLKSFTCGFDLRSASGMELTFDERSKAEYMSYIFRTEHYEMVLKSGDMERVMPRLAWHIEEPRVGQSYPNFYVAQLASKFVKVVLSGTGGDELFGGYPWRYYSAVTAGGFDDYVRRYYGYWQRMLTDGERRELFSPVWGTVKHVEPEAIFRGVLAGHKGPLERPEDCINHSLYLEAKTFLHGLLVVEDKHSMAHGLETRLPFLDNDLVDFAVKLPVRLKVRGGGVKPRLNENEPGPKAAKYYEQAQDGKLLLRQMMDRHVPNEISSGVKQGFSAPDGSWFKGESIDFVRRTLLEGRPRLHEFLDPKVLASLISDHVEGRANRRLLIWSLLSVEWWCRSYL